VVFAMHATSLSAHRVGGVDIATLCRADCRWKHETQLDGKCTSELKSQHSIPRCGARTAGPQRLSGAPYFGGATHITP